MFPVAFREIPLSVLEAFRVRHVIHPGNATTQVVDVDEIGESGTQEV